MRGVDGGWWLNSINFLSVLFMCSCQVINFSEGLLNLSVTFHEDQNSTTIPAFLRSAPSWRTGFGALWRY